MTTTANTDVTTSGTSAALNTTDIQQGMSLNNYQPQVQLDNQPAVHLNIQPVNSNTSNLNPTYGFNNQQLISSTGTSFHANNPYLPPPVPAQCLTKIKNMEYVEFGSLLTNILPNSLSMAMITEGEDEEEFCLSQIQTPGAAATFKKKSRRNAISNFQTWVLAWNVFYETTLHFFPDKHHELFTYFKHISEYSVSHKFNFLAAYDKAHRVHIAAQKNLPASVQTSSWTKHCPSLYNLYLKNNTTAKCNNCLAWGHYEKQCPLQKNQNSLFPFQTPPPIPPMPPQPTNLFRNVPQQQQQHQATNSTKLNTATNNNSASNSAEKQTCFRYNKGRSCQQAQCTYPHICCNCLQQGFRLPHPATQCPNTTSTIFRP